MDFGHCLRAIRMEQGYSLRQLAKKSGYSTSYVSEIEAGKRLPGFFALQCLIAAMSASEERNMIFSLYCKEKMRKVVRDIPEESASPKKIL